MIKLFSIFMVIHIVFGQDCSLGRDAGNANCGESGAQRFYYDSKRGICQPFYYRGCDGNGNRFESRDECMSNCKGTKTKSGGPVARCKAGNPAAMNENGEALKCDGCPDRYQCEDNLCCPTRESACDLDYDAGKYVQGRSHIPKYFYIKSLQSCILFTYFGSLGNGNNFDTVQQCLDFCK